MKAEIKTSSDISLAYVQENFGEDTSKKKWLSVESEVAWLEGLLALTDDIRLRKNQLIDLDRLIEKRIEELKK